MQEYGSIVNRDIAQPEGTEAKVILGGPGEKKGSGGLMQVEERAVGVVPWAVTCCIFVYQECLPGICFLVLLALAEAQGNTLLEIWPSDGIHGFRQGDYVGACAGLGVASTVLPT
ncbi:hypothetical protein FIBSPDRAFT_966929 [Athelia psychrophila]|uniref:Uncharacterized protein n=1 Tax=Athelia psychrophila TaxID=1759441 RepID=A0A167W9P4_9AGAM|nr:hypothetical protein FIBSPDRAFT_966929 [Fibularhizoctonia sp. CBS 109695]